MVRAFGKRKLVTGIERRAKYEWGCIIVVCAVGVVGVVGYHTVATLKNKISTRSSIVADYLTKKSANAFTCGS